MRNMFLECVGLGERLFIVCVKVCSLSSLGRLILQLWGELVSFYQSFTILVRSLVHMVFSKITSLISKLYLFSTPPITMYYKVYITSCNGGSI